MRAVVQRVSRASVEADGRTCGAVEQGLLVYLGVAREDGPADVDYIVDKVRHLRIFEDDAGRMNRDVVQAGGSVLVVSAFTVHADARRGRRPTFEAAAAQDRAVVLYELFCDALAQSGVRIQRGSFGDTMAVHSINAGPVCVLLDSQRVF